MASPNDFRQIIRNMQVMGWKVTEVAGSGGYSYKVAAPGRPIATINTRANHGSASMNTATAIRNLGYAEAWETFQQHQRADRLAKVAAAPPRPPTAPAVPQEAEADPRPFVDGKKVMERVRAKDNPPGAGGRFVEINGVDEVLLEDGTVVYQCTRSPERCSQVFDNVKSCVSHLRAHGTPSESARRDALHVQRSAAGQAAQATMRERRVRLIGDESRAAFLNEFADQLAEAIPMLRQLARMTVECPAPPISEAELAELRAKAAKFDNLRGLLG